MISSFEIPREFQVYSGCVNGRENKLNESLVVFPRRAKTNLPPPSTVTTSM
jgi:hypothetical protein